MPGEASTSIVVPKAVKESLQKQIDDIGFGWFQLGVLCCTGGVMMSEGAEVLIMGSVTTLLDKDWGLSNFIQGFMVSVVFIGFAGGNLLSGAIGDKYGRRPTILLAYVIIGGMGFLTSFAENAWTMTFLRFCVGVGCGIGFPSIYTLIPEVCPSNVRGAVSACMIGFMPLGEIYASLGVIFIDKELEGLQHNAALLPADSWRRLCQWSALPSFLFFTLCYFFLWESPFYLASRDRTQELDALLETMAVWNGHAGQHKEDVEPSASPVVVPDNKIPQEVTTSAQDFSWVAAVQTCVSRQYLSTTLVLLVAHFTKDFSVFGLNYVFPQYFGETAGPMAIGWEMFTISFIAMPGVLVAVGLTQTDYVGSIASISLLAFLCGLAAWGLLDWGPQLMHSLCAYVVKFMALAYFIVTVVYTAEVFPTSIRNTAVGLCTSCGRAGSILAPLAFSLTTGFDFFWSMIIICMWTVAVCSRCCLTVETKGRALVDLQHTEKGAEGYGAVLLGKKV